MMIKWAYDVLLHAIASKSKSDINWNPSVWIKKMLNRSFLWNSLQIFCESTAAEGAKKIEFLADASAKGGGGCILICFSSQKNKNA